VLTKRSCPHTGIINFYERTEPLLAIGSVSAGAAPARFIWRSYSDDQEAGVTCDISIAEALLRNAIMRSRSAHA
jgi:hypothetical protein